MMKIKYAQEKNEQKPNNKTKSLPKKKYSKGITLISLVITIIILIILAGISINMVIGNNGLFTKAREAQAKFLNAQAGEEERLAELEKEIAENENLPANTKDTLAGTQVKLPSKWVTTIAAEYSTENGNKVKNEVRVANVRAIATGNGEEVPVPKGFYYVGGTIDSGVVISDNIKDENKYASYTITEGNEVKEGIPAGVFYKNDGTVKAYEELTDDQKQKAIIGNQFVWIPVTEDNPYVKTNWGNENTYKNATWESQTPSSELIQIKKYGGFYIGRYEAGTSGITLTASSENVDFSKEHTATNWKDEKFSIREGNSTLAGKITCKAGEIPYYHADHYTALTLCINMYEGSEYVQSGLITGTMWDVMMNFIAGQNKEIVTTNCTWGNFNQREGEHVKYAKGQGRYTIVDSNGSNEVFKVSDENYYYGIRTTASTEGVKKKNLYDVAGNLWEWTQEAAYADNTQESYMQRGGNFAETSSIYPACYRGFDSATDTNVNYGFRPALYIM